MQNIDVPVDSTYTENHGCEETVAIWKETNAHWNKEVQEG